MTDPVAADTQANPVEIGRKVLDPEGMEGAQEIDRTLRSLYAALEAAGFRIIGPEPTDAQIGAAANDRPLNETVKWARYAIHGVARRFWSVMHAAAPRWGDGQ